MHKSLQLIFLTIIFNLTLPNLFGQYLQQYFDGADTIPESSLIINIDTSYTNVWEVGAPSKIIFNQASTVPNVLITDSIEHYPINDSSSFTITLPYHEYWQWGIFQLNWMQKIDLERENDFGFIEYSFDGGLAWNNVVDDGYVYSFYGYDQDNLMSNANLEQGFSGTDSTWKNVWLCMDATWLTEMDSIQFRFRLDTDSIETNQEGWMIDNMMQYIGIIHTVNEETSKSYMDITPNPTTGRVNINTEKIEGYHAIEHMELIDQMGRTVQEFGLSPTKFHIDIGHHPNGNYILRVRTNIRTESYRIVLQKE